MKNWGCLKVMIPIEDIFLRLCQELAQELSFFFLTQTWKPGGILSG
jgi:hypothetical protein